MEPPTEQTRTIAIGGPVFSRLTAYCGGAQVRALSSHQHPVPLRAVDGTDAASPLPERPNTVLVALATLIGRDIHSKGAAPVSGERFEAFISYARTASGRLAIDLQNELERFAKPWNRLRVIRVFRDDSSMSANTALWSTIEKGLQESEWFILLATPSAAASEYVNNEVAWWVAHKGAERILLVHHAGTLSWDRALGDFSSDTDAVPPALRGAYGEEPRWVDLRWYAEEGSLERADPRFAERVADLSSAVRGIERDTLIGENVRQHRRSRRFQRAATAGLTVLLVAALSATGVAVAQSREAVRQRDVAEEQALVATARQLAATAENLAETDLERALLLADTAYRTRQEPQTVHALHAVVSATPQLVGFFNVGEPVTVVDGTPDGGVLAVGTSAGSVLLIDRATGTREELVTLPGEVSFVAVSEDGATVAAAWATWDEQESRPTTGSWIWQEGDMTTIDGNVVALSPSGRTAALLSAVETDSMMGDFMVEVIVDGERRGVARTGPATHWVDLPDDSTVVAMNEYGEFSRTQLGTGEVERTRTPMGTWMFGGDISQDGTRFTYSNGGEEVEVWNLPIPLDAVEEEAEPVLSGLAGNANIADVALNADGTRMATAASGSIYVSDVSAIGEHRGGPTELQGAGEDPHSLEFLDDDLLVSASGSSAALWDLSRVTPLATIMTAEIGGTCSACLPQEVLVSPDARKVVTGPGFGTTVADLATGYTRTTSVFPAPVDPADIALGAMVGALWVDDTRLLLWSEDGRGWLLGGDNLTTIEGTLAFPAVTAAALRDDGSVVLLANGAVQSMDTGTWEIGAESVPADALTADGAYAVRTSPSAGGPTEVEVHDTTTFKSIITTLVDGRLAAFAEHVGPGRLALLRFVDDGVDTELLSLDLGDGTVTTVGRLGLSEETLRINVASAGTALAVEESGEIGLYSLQDASRLSLVPVTSGVRVWNALGFNRDGSALVIASEPQQELLRVRVTSEAWSELACTAAGRALGEEELARAVGGSVDGLRRGCSGDVGDGAATDGRTPTAITPSTTPRATQDSSDVPAVVVAPGWDVSGYELAAFSSPSGVVWCAIEDGRASCAFASGIPPGTKPDREEACPGEPDFGVGGVWVDTEVRWACSGGVLVWPQAETFGSEWASEFAAGRALVGEGGAEFVTLPYGETVSNDDISCTSRQEGITCVNTRTGAGVTVSETAIITLDGAPLLPHRDNG